MSAPAQAAARPTCVVLMPLGKKSLPGGRVLDFDAAFEAVRGVLEEAGFDCRRAGEASAEGRSAEYELLLTADMVIADVTRQDPSVLYRLGVRHGSRPGRTLLIGESDLRPLAHLEQQPLLRYSGRSLEDPRSAELRDFQEELQRRLLLAEATVSSPVYERLRLEPPRLPSAGEHTPRNPRLAALLETAERAVDEERWEAAWTALREARKFEPDDHVIARRLAEILYTHADPDGVSGALEARDLLAGTRAAESAHPEILELWASANGRVWGITEDRPSLDAAIEALHRLVRLAPDASRATARDQLILWKSRAAYLRENRAALSDPEAAVDDWTKARELRGEVLASVGPREPLADARTAAALWEAAVALGDKSAERRWMRRFEALGPEELAGEAAREQVEEVRELRALLEGQFAEAPPRRRAKRRTVRRKR